MGPLEVIAIEFTGRRFKSEIMRVLDPAVEHGAIRIVDLTFIRKDAAGTVTSYELAELDEADAAHFDAVDETLGLLSVSDIETLGVQLTTGAAAAALVIEHAWVTDLRRGLATAGGRLVAREPMSRDPVTGQLSLAPGPKPKPRQRPPSR